ncbi:MAG: response regulator [Elusimicrobia bacterium]|nr:response regulator [Elusimicrobiota bacterium]
MEYKILAVDDEREIRELLSAELEQQGYVISTAKDGKECLEKIKDEKFDLILLDLQMPKLSGLQTLIEIKKIEPNVDVIIMTAHATVSTAVESLKTNAYDYVTKPFNFDELKHKIKKCLEKDFIEKPKILIVDDDLIAADTLRDILTRENFQVTLAKNGKTAVEITKKSPPDLVLMDIMLPDISGWETCKIIKSNVKTSHIPIIFLTARMVKIEDEIASLKLGADDYISRPCDIDILVNRIRNTLNKTERIRNLKETVAMYEITNAISSLMEVDELLNLVLKLAVEISDSDGGSLMFYKPETEELEIKTTYGDFKENIVGQRIRFGERIVGTAIEKKRPILIHGSLKNDPRFNHLERYNGVKSAIIVPMLVKEKLIGCINLKRTKRDKRFSTRESNLLALFASQAALAVENVSLHDEIKKHAEMLDIKVKERTQQLEKAYEELKTSQDNLVRSEKLRTLGQVATNIAHEFKNYLSIIKMSAEYSLLKLPMDNKVKDQLKTIIENEELAFQAVKNFSAFAKPSDITMQSCNINDILDGTCHFLDIRFKQQKVELVKKYGKDIPGLMLDRTYIQSVFINLIINALQAMGLGGKVLIETAYDPVSKNVVISITDTGGGIPQDKIESIFEPFFTTRLDGTGLGLAIAKRIIDYHHGRIDIKSQPGKGTVVSVYFPVESEKKQEVKN